MFYKARIAQLLAVDGFNQREIENVLEELTSQKRFVNCAGKFVRRQRRDGLSSCKRQLQTASNRIVLF